MSQQAGQGSCVGLRQKQEPRQKLPQAIAPRGILFQEGSLALKAHRYEILWILVSEL